MGGRGSKRVTGSAGGARIEIPESKRKRRGSNPRQRRLGEPGSPIGTEQPRLPLRPRRRGEEQ